jgi:hypothetical protein
VGAKGWRLGGKFCRLLFSYPLGADTGMVRPPNRARRFAGHPIMTLLLAALAGCASAVTPALVKPPPKDPATLLVGEIAADDPEARRLARFLRQALIDRLLRAGAFAVVYDRESRGAGESALVLSGEIAEADRGSDAWRFVIGAGVGRPRLAGVFRVGDAQGSVLAAFTVTSDEIGPSGLSGHWSPVSMEGMATELGHAAADTVVRWRRGEPIAKVTWP